jgi:hypothetical protein
MVFRQNTEDPVTLRSYLQLDAPAIVRILVAMDESRFLTAFAQFDNGVVAKPQALRGIRHGRLHLVGSSCKVQQQLVLLRVEACFSGATFAKLQEST